MAQNRENVPRPAKKSKIETNAAATQEVDNDIQLVRMFCVDLLPRYLFEGNGFQEFIRNISNYNIPSTITISQEIIREEYKRTRKVLVDDLARVQYVAVTIDDWKLGVTGRRTGRSMWTATIHFVHQGKLKSQILFTIEAALRKDDSIAREINNELCKFGIFQKVVCFITRSGKKGVLKDAIHTLQKHYIPCVASTINLVVQEALEFVCTHTALEKNKNMNDEPFSWYNTYMDFKDIISNESNYSNFIPTEHKLLGEMFHILKPFEEFNNTLSSKQYLTLSYIIPLVTGLKLRISDCSPSTALAEELKEKVMKSIDKHFKIYESDTVVALATFMDPRFKKKAVFTQDKPDSVQQAVIQELMECENSYHQQNLFPSASKVNQEKGNLLSYLSERKNKTEQTERTVRSSRAVEHYVDILDSNPDEDPYEFWEEFNRVSRCSQFYSMSQKYLCIPATAVPIESPSGEFFWKKNDSNNINFNERRNLLEPENINEILFLHSYYSINK